MFREQLILNEDIIFILKQAKIRIFQNKTSNQSKLFENTKKQTQNFPPIPKNLKNEVDSKLRNNLRIQKKLV